MCEQAGVLEVVLVSIEKTVGVSKGVSKGAITW